MDRFHAVSGDELTRDSRLSLSCPVRVSWLVTVVVEVASNARVLFEFDLVRL